MMLNVALVASYAATIPVANWLIGNVGTVCVPNGPCLIPVAPGLTAPSGVLMVGIALVLRDLVQEKCGLTVAFTAILLGAIASFFLATPMLAIASAVAFLSSELADLSVYTPLRRKNKHFAVLASGIVGAMMDSILFLLIAFGSLDYLAGQFVGKLWASIVVAAWMFWRHNK